ncbi:MAG TPA: phosphatidylserine decarboxylase, partial [Rubricoccaceae bacterium]
KQIAGAVARRIVYDAPVGKTMTAGERYGIVKFGSRMDVVVPPHVRLDVTIGQKTVAGETVIGHIPDEAPAEMPAGQTGDGR